MLSMDSILRDRPSKTGTPEVSSESDSPVETEQPGTEQAASETPAPAPAKTAAKETRQATEPQQATEADDDSEAEGNDPADIAGLKRALAASRGDKRTLRKQWREAELKLAQLEGRIAAMQQQAAKPVEEAKRPEPEDPETAFYANPTGFVDQRVQTVEQRLREINFKTSIRLAQRAYPDFAEKEAAFVDAAKRNPHLAQQLRDHEDPAEFAYQTGKEHLEFLEWQRSRQAGAAAPASEPAKQQTSARPPIPRSIAGARGTSVGAAKPWVGPKSLDEILTG